MSAWLLPSVELRDFADVVQQIARERLDRHVDALERDDRIPDAAHEVLVENGLWALGIPADGEPVDLLALVVAVAEIATAMPAAALAIVDVHLLALAAPHDDILLERLRGGGYGAWLSGPAVTVTSDAARVREARCCFGGEGVAGLVVDERAVLVDGDGWTTRTRTAVVSRSGMRGAPAPAVSLDAAGQPSHVDPDTGRALRSLLLAAIGAGLATAATAHATAYAAERRQFGGPIASIPSVSARLQDVSSRAQTLRQAVVDATNAPRSSAADRVATLVSRTLVPLTCDCLQVLGGYGYLEEYPLARIVRDAISLQAQIASTRAPSLR